MNWIKGRPDDWKETCDCKDLPSEQQCSMYKNYEAGASAMLSAVVKWLDEPCTRHKHYNEYSSTYSHMECTQCMKELRGEK